MHRHLRPFAAAVGLLVLASALWWLWLDDPRPAAPTTAPPPDDPQPAPPPPSAAPGPAPPRVRKEQLAEPVAPAQADLHLPGALPPIDAVIAPALPDPDPPIESLEILGQLHPSAGQLAARAAWPTVQRCAGDWQGDLHLSFGIAGGERVGDSRYWEPKVSGPPEPIQACITAELAQARLAAATDANGTIAVVFHLTRDPP